MMRIFDFLGLNKKTEPRKILNHLGEFIFSESNDEKQYVGLINCYIGSKIELIFVINESKISDYQIDYFQRIEKNWNFILDQLYKSNPAIDFKNFKVQTIMIPDKIENCYDVDAEIVFIKKEEIISVILNELNVEEIIEIQ